MDFQPLLAIGATIGTNYMYSNQIGSLSDDNKLAMTPHSKTFSIWGIIYIMLILSSAYHLKQPWNVNTLDPFFYTCLFNQLWLISWSNGYTITSQVLLYLLSGSIFKAWQNSHGFEMHAFATYGSWCIGASVLNTLINLKKYKLLQDPTISYLGISALCTVQIIGQLAVRDVLSNPVSLIALPIVGIWTGIGILNNDSSLPKIIKYAPVLVSGLCLFHHLYFISR